MTRRVLRRSPVRSTRFSQTARNDLIGVDIAAIQRHARRPVIDRVPVPSAYPRSAGVAKTPGDRGGGGDGGGDQVRAAAFALTAFEVAVAGRRRSVRPARACRGSCRGTSSSPASRHSKPAAAKTAVEPFGLGLRLDPHRTRHDHRPHARPEPAALDDRRPRPAGPRSAVGARADEDRVDRDFAHRRARP